MMSHDRDLIDTIKMNFARKSSAQLREIAQTGNLEQWSPEAVAAAGEVLQDREAGHAEEPAVPEEERPPLVLPTVPYSLGLIVGFLPIFVLNGFRFGSEFAPGDRDNLPVPFGPKMAWLALDTNDTEAVAAALGLREPQYATWAEGIAAAARTSVFVTPPLGDWTLAVGAALFPPERPETLVKPLLEQLSGQFGDAQYFCTHQDAELHGWARAIEGRLVRGFAWLGQKRLTLWDEGGHTREERDLGFRLPPAERAPDIATGIRRPTDRISVPAAETAVPDEASVLQLASLWSINPTTLDAQFMEPMTGLLGHVARVESNRAMS
jgi:hypothetical protein